MTNELRKAELRARIQAAATSVFLKKGYAETKISDIAAQAKISPSTIYLYFNGKKDLFNSLDIPQAAGLRPEFERKKEAITRVALSLFGERGFEGTTMDDIAEKVGFSKAALYQYCSSKEDLFLQVLRLYTHAIPPAPDTIGGDTDDWRTVTRNVARTYMDLSRDPDRTAFLGSVIRDSNKFPDFGATYYEQSFCTARGSFLGYLHRQQKKGNIRKDIDLTAKVTSFFCALTGYMILFNVVGGMVCDVDQETFIDQTVDTMIRGLEK